MAIISVTDLQNYMGITFTDTQTVQAAYIVDYINGFINDETDTSFGLETGVTIRVRTDVDGEYILQNIPVSAVTLIHDVATDTDLTSDQWIFDGIDTLCGFWPGQVLDVTMDFGVDPVPGSIIGVALSMAKRAMGQLISNTDSGLVLKQVGDVIYQFGDVLSPNKNEQTVLDAYSVTEFTMKLDSSGTFLKRGRRLPLIPDVSFLP